MQAPFFSIIKKGHAIVSNTLVICFSKVYFLNGDRPYFFTLTHTDYVYIIKIEPDTDYVCARRYDYEQ